MSSLRIACQLAGLAAGALLLPAVALAQSESSSPSPASIPFPAPSGLPGGIFLSTPDASVGAGAGKAVTFPLDVVNNTPKIEYIHLAESGAPQAWQPVFQDGSNDVSELELLPGKDDNITFQVTPPSDAPHQPQAIDLKGSTDDGLATTLGLTVQVTGQTTSGLGLTTNYPSLRGNAGTKFEFTLTIANNTGKDTNVDLSAPAPSTDWQVFFQQSASQTQISNTAVKSGQTQDVNLEVTAPGDGKPGDYPINVEVADSGGNNAKTTLTVTILGDYKVDLTTPDQTLSGTVTAGQPNRVTLLVENTGNAALKSVAMSASNLPNGWNVTFQPSTIDNVDPNTTSQVQALVTAAGSAAPGDYAIQFSASTSQATVDKDFRVTVQNASPWPYVGIATAVVLVGIAVWLLRMPARA